MSTDLITDDMVETAAKALFAIEEPDRNALRRNHRTALLPPTPHQGELT